MSNRYLLPLIPRRVRDKAPKSVRRADDVAIVFGQALPLTLHPSLVDRVKIRRNVGNNIDPEMLFCQKMAIELVRSVAARSTSPF